MASKNGVRFSRAEHLLHSKRVHTNRYNDPINLISPNNMMNNLLLTVTILAACLATNDAFVPSAHPIHSLQVQVKTAFASSAADRSYLYKEEPTDLEREVLKEEHDPKHSSFHVEKGPLSIDDKNDPVHSIHHHLVDVDHGKIHDLELRAQHAWTPVNVHEMDVDGFSAAAALFGVFTFILLLVWFASH